MRRRICSWTAASAAACAAFFVSRQQHTSRVRTPGTRVGTLAATLELAALIALGVGIYIAITGTSRLRDRWTDDHREAGVARVGAGCTFAGVRMTLRSRVPFSIRTRMVNLTSRARLRLRDDMRVFYLLIVVACLLLAVGPPLGPWRYIYWIPGLSFIRVPSRFMILGTLGIAVLCAYGFARLTRTTSSTTRRIATMAATPRSSLNSRWCHWRSLRVRDRFRWPIAGSRHSPRRLSSLNCRPWIRPFRCCTPPCTGRKPCTATADGIRTSLSR